MTLASIQCPFLPVAKPSKVFLWKLAFKKEAAPDNLGEQYAVPLFWSSLSLFYYVQRFATPIGSIRHYFPSHGRRTNRRLAPPSGIQTPPRIAPRCHHYWMNIEYHYRFTGSSQDNLPQLFLAGWTRYAPFMAVIYRTGKGKNLNVLQMVFAHPPHRSPPFFSGGP